MVPDLLLVIGAFLAALVPIVMFYAVKLLLYRDVALDYFKASGVVLKPEPIRQKKSSTYEEIGTMRAVLLTLIMAVGVGGTAWTITGMWQAALAVSVVGLTAPKLYSSWQKGGREKQLGLQVEQAVETMAAVIRSGGGLLGALETALRDAKEPLRGELAQTVAEIKLTAPAAEAFAALAARLKVPELEMASYAMAMQQTGMAVNLAVVFDTVQEQMRQNRAAEEYAMAKTAQERQAGWIIAVIPFATIGMVRQIAPDFVSFLFTDVMGIAIMVICTAAIIAGIVWIMRLAKSLMEVV